MKKGKGNNSFFFFNSWSQLFLLRSQPTIDERVCWMMELFSLRGGCSPPVSGSDMKPRAAAPGPYCQSAVWTRMKHPPPPSLRFQQQHPHKWPIWAFNKCLNYTGACICLCLLCFKGNSGVCLALGPHLAGTITALDFD